MREGLPSITMREIAILHTLSHPNIVRLRRVIQDFAESMTWLIFDFMATDLRKYLDACREAALRATELANENVGQGLPVVARPVVDCRHRKDGLHPHDLKVLMFQLLSGLAHAHAHGVLHRDIKPPNILMNTDGTLQLADFGLSRGCSKPVRAYTHETITLWYRAPEVLLGSSFYTTAVDVWSAGCVFAEMASFTALWRGDSEFDQLMRIFRTLGTPDDVEWTGVTSLRDWMPEFPKFRGFGLHASLPMLQYDPDALDLLSRLLVLQPSKRLSAAEALLHPYFRDILEEA